MSTEGTSDSSITLPMLAAFVEDRSDIARAIAVSARYEDHADAEVLVTVASSLTWVGSTRSTHPARERRRAGRPSGVTLPRPLTGGDVFEAHAGQSSWSG